MIKKLLKKESFKLDKKPYYVGMDNGNPLEEPEITIEKDGDAIKTIEVRCTCGKVIKLECS